MATRSDRRRYCQGGGDVVFQAWQFPVGPPSGSDDTAHINAVMSNAVTYAQANSFYAEVIFSAGVYQIGAATIQGGATKGNAQIPMPVISPTGQKVTLKLTGTGGAVAPWFQSTVSLLNGTVLKSTLSGQVFSGTFGIPSVIGGPTPQQGYGNGITNNLFSNLLLIIDGITVMGITNPDLAAFDLVGIGQVLILEASAIQPAVFSSIAYCTNAAAVGMRMPAVNNNARSDVRRFYCQGYFYGFNPGEHTHAYSVEVSACTVGLAPQGPTYHPAHIVRLITEQCQTNINADYTTGPASGGVGALLDIDQWDIEDGVAPLNPTSNFSDPSNFIYGTARFIRVLANTGNQNGLTAVSGGTNYRFTDMWRTTGHMASPPAVPATTVAATLIYRDAMVSIHTGVGVTVSAITIDGTATGQTIAASSSLTVQVPSGKTIALTYAGGTPTWDWWLV